jgi:ABC-type branched-subunit amino acid transport system ATPase component
MKMGSEYILEIESVTKGFSKNIANIRGEEDDERFNIIDDLSLMVPKNKITALIGGNGAGKTTLFNVISGFMDADSGNIFFSNKEKINLIGMQPHCITRLGIGRLFQDNHVFPRMTVLENMIIADSNRYGELPFISMFSPKKNQDLEDNRAQRAKDIFQELFGASNPFWEKKDDPTDSLSFGQQRLLSLARLFMGDYSLVLLDEPTSGINPNLVRDILGIIKKMVAEKKITAFLIEHNMRFVLEIADFCNFMSHGCITAFGTPKDVIGDNEVRKTYLGA